MFSSSLSLSSLNVDLWIVLSHIPWRENILLCRITIVSNSIRCSISLLSPHESRGDKLRSAKLKSIIQKWIGEKHLHYDATEWKYVYLFSSTLPLHNSPNRMNVISIIRIQWFIWYCCSHSLNLRFIETSEEMKSVIIPY